MPLIVFKSGNFEVICHPDKIDAIIKGNEYTSGVTINGNFYKLESKRDLATLVEDYERAMRELEGV